jgi:hypothetical protein
MNTPSESNRDLSRTLENDQLFQQAKQEILDKFGILPDRLLVTKISKANNIDRARTLSGSNIKGDGLPRIIVGQNYQIGERPMNAGFVVYLGNSSPYRKVELSILSKE